MEKNGNIVLIRSDTDGTEVRRNVTHIKKYNAENEDLSQTDSGSHDTTDLENLKDKWKQVFKNRQNNLKGLKEIGNYLRNSKTIL